MKKTVAVKTTLIVGALSAVLVHPGEEPGIATCRGGPRLIGHCVSPKVVTVTGAAMWIR